MTRRLSELTTLRLGGPAERLVEVRTEDELVEALRAVDAAGEPLLVLGGGSNVVVADEGFPGTVVLIATRGVERREAHGRTELTVQAGEPWEPFVERCVAEGLAGVEALSGIPGSIGATPIQNVGAYGQEVAETITGVRVFDRRRGAIEELSPEACEFGYRTSLFKRVPDRWVVLAVSFALERSDIGGPVTYPELARALGVEVGERAPLTQIRDAVLRLRRAKGMVIDPDDPDSVSAGSFFTNPVLSEDQFAALETRAHEKLGAEARPPRFPQPHGRVKTSAAWLIERSGFARSHGDPLTVSISSKHTLALTNRGAGTSTQLLALARELAEGVEREWGVALRPEPVLIGQAWAQPPDIPS